MDTQVIEIIGRNRLIDELLRAGLEIAVPLRDRGIDLIVYADLPAFFARPIQMKAASGRSFSINKKYDKFPNLIHAFVWGLGSGAEAATYALTQREAVAVGHKMGYTATSSWREAGAYSTQQPSQKLLKLLEPYLTTPQMWRKKIGELDSE